jgi:phenol hydroxylase P5 protein
MKQATITAVDTLAPRLFRLRLKPQGGLEFKAGQFIIVSLPQDPSAAPGAKAPKGFYSLASPEQDASEIEILVEERAGYVSNWMCGRRPGDELSLEGPLGKFLVRPDFQGVQVFLGSKAGLAPLRSMILSLARKDPRPQTHLFLGGEKVMDQEWLNLAKSTAAFQYHPCEDPAAKMLETIMPGPGHAIYMAGFNAEVEPMLARLLEAGFEKDSISVERFG